MDILEYRLFSDINLNDNFFDTLKRDYTGFEKWFKKKAEQQEQAYILEDSKRKEIDGFLYLKEESGPIEDIVPVIQADRVIKIGTMKINAHGTKLGERFIKKVLDHAIANKITVIYVTVFSKHDSLINLYKRYGFKEWGVKQSSSGEEKVLLKDMNKVQGEILQDYPKININKGRKYVLSIYPKYHTKLFPDSILKGESYDLIQDTSYTNSIHKIYVCNMYSVGCLKKGDIVLVYRTTDGSAPAAYRSVISGICVVEEVKSKNEFNGYQEFFRYTNKYSIFEDKDLRRCYNKEICYTIKMTYNAIFNKKVINRELQNIMANKPNYWGFFELQQDEFLEVITRGEVDESFIIH